MMAGHTLLKVFAGFTYTYLITFQLIIILNSSITFLLINPVLIALTGLEVGVAFIQGYVFLSLNAMYATDTKDLH
jgi:F0F1-type ATP synthase membrane subunit a